MQSTNIPSKIPLPFAYAAGSSYKNPIPTASQIGITNGKASLTDGFPPLTFQAISSGGVPPFGADFNGILNEITAIQQWQEAGGFFPFDPTFSAAVGGYPKGAVIQSSTQNGFWVSVNENNTANPDTATSNAGWLPLGWTSATYIGVTGGTVNFTMLNAAYPIIILNGTLTSNLVINMPLLDYQWIVFNATTPSSYTVTVKTVIGSGVQIPQGASSFLFSDATSIFSATSASVASFNGRTGTVSLNATDVTNALGFSPIPLSGVYGVGINQTWQDYTSYRTFGSTYTNTTSIPISVSINVDLADFSTNSACTLYVNGIPVGYAYQSSSPSTININMQLSAVIPPGASYFLTQYGSSSIYNWLELR